MDDIISSVDTVAESQELTGQIDTILEKGGFKIKCWITSHDNGDDVG